jgi:trehalose 6-phosphate synthase
VIVARGPLDVANLQQISQDPVTLAWRDRLRRQADGRVVVARAERLDLWKNVPRGFVAFEQLLERSPGLADEVCFFAVLSPVSSPSPRHLRYRQASEAIAARINARYHRPGRDGPIVLVYPSDKPGTSRQRTVAALSLCDAALVNPTFDGLNLVAKEALLLSSGSAVLLSTNAGVHEQVGPYVTPLSPFDVEETSALLESAIDGRLAPSPAERARGQDLLRAENAESWLATIMAASEG